MTPKERPALFSGDLVRALLDGRKTTTRRQVALTDEAAHIASHPTARWGFTVASSERRHRDRWSVGMEDPNGTTFSDRRETKVSGIACPFGNAGDLLYVRETWAPVTEEGVRLSGSIAGMADNAYPVAYRVGADLPESVNHGPWRPPIHMPKWAARIWLRNAGVRVERVQDITEASAKAEGVTPFCAPEWDMAPYRAGFRRVWSDIYGDWDANPWVFVVDFEVLSTTGRP